MPSLTELVDKRLSDKKIANNKAEFDVMYPTGFLSIDYLNGTQIYVNGNGRNFTYNSTGIVDGSTNTIIGRSGSGKSTLMCQMIGNIARTNPDIMIYFDDIEGSLPESRKLNLLQMTEEEWERRVRPRKDGITTESVYQRIRAIYDEKMANRKDFMYDTGLFDMSGNPIRKMIPTIYAIDSFAMLMPESLETEEGLGTNMSGGQTAKQNSMLIKKIAQLGKEANIILFTINHITTGIQAGYIPKQSQLAGLASDERLPGGGTAIYLANNMFRVDDGAKLTPDKDYGIDGSVIKFTIIKSRTNANRKSIPLIFNKTEGKFDEILSYFHLLHSEGLIKGAGVKLYIPELPEVTFSRKSFKETFMQNKELRSAFIKKLYDYLCTYLSITKSISKDDTTMIDEIHDLFNGFANPQV